MIRRRHLHIPAYQKLGCSRQKKQTTQRHLFPSLLHTSSISYRLLPILSLSMDKGGSFGDAEVVCQDRYGFSYEAAMEALSTLISRRKRGDGPKRDDKLGRMSMYMKVVCLFCLPDSMCFGSVSSFACWVVCRFWDWRRGWRTSRLSTSLELKGR